MEKLRIWAIRCVQSTPKILAICSICPPLFTSASKASAFMIAIPFSPGHSRLASGAHDAALLHEENGVEHDRFSEGNGQDRLDQNFRGRAWIASDRIRSFHSDQSHTQGCGKRRQTDVQISARLCKQGGW